VRTYIVFILISWLLSTHALAASAPDEVSFSGGWMISENPDFSDRPLLSVDLTWIYDDLIFLRGYVQLSTTNIAPSVAAMNSQPDDAAMANFVGVSPGFMVMTGYSVSRLRFLIGVGMSYHLRFVNTHDSFLGESVFGEEAGSGNLEKLDLNDHPGIEGCVEFSVDLTSSWSLFVYAGYSYATVTAYASLNETDAYFLSQRRDLSAYGGRLGLTYAF
jgi:hypothetical protein